jgi:hypothetical protein
MRRHRLAGLRGLCEALILDEALILAPHHQCTLSQKEIRRDEDGC